MLRIIREEDAPPLSRKLTTMGAAAADIAARRQTDPASLRRLVDGDLNRIAMKALEKVRARRYCSVAELAADIQRYVEHRPVLASPPSVLYRARKFLQRQYRRRRLEIALASVALLAGIVTGIDMWHRQGNPPLPTTKPGQLSVAVLPLENLSGDPANEYFSDGMSEEISSKLSRIQTLTVAPYSLTAHLKATPKSARGIARELQVRYLLDGSVYQKAAQNPPLTEAGPVSADAAWERIAYFLKRVIPVADEHKVRMACHPHDPGMPPGKGFRGVDRVLGSVDGLKRFIEIAPSPYHGLNFCQGTISEMLAKPADEIFDVIRYFGMRGKIFNVHFRNIKGGFLNFQETFPDDGDVNMIRAMRVFKGVGYDGMLMPDHVPVIDGDAGGKQAFAYAYGYIQALIQMVNMEGPSTA
jgi:sugar phosphate isomerase/epimerase